MRIGPHSIAGRAVAAPMAGVTDRPFRQLCKRLGAGLAASEMVTANSALWHTKKSRLRADHSGEARPVVVQIAGSDPKLLAEAARHNVDLGAEIIDINMGCPAKKVCKVAAGSALLRDESLVGRILDQVVGAVDVPVTLKIRTGWSPESRNAVRVGRLAESAGVQALAVHGRTRNDFFGGDAEYDTIGEVKSSVRIPVIANGDIDSAKKAKRVLAYTGADAVMIGRAAQGRPWLFREVNHFLDRGKAVSPPNLDEIHSILVDHLHSLYGFYGENCGVRIARKHLGWYTRPLDIKGVFRRRANALESAHEQLSAVGEFFDGLKEPGSGVVDVFGQAA